MLDFEYVLQDDSINMRKITFECSGLLWERRLEKLERILKE
jgi:hypothetical protein